MYYILWHVLKQIYLKYLNNTTQLYIILTK